ncbi:MAG: hypothetical protein QM496_10635 [Verrucomicrobiota bacterium]
MPKTCKDHHLEKSSYESTERLIEGAHRRLMVNIGFSTEDAWRFARQFKVSTFGCVQNWISDELGEMQL